ncbi:hypothetical protein HNY73_015059 [Argiope bruennichi]|uniref:Uncharacterized protein n=1 Tax=Argiope bruennichi TaxID=94029 RepID=A0A8T0ESB4_ARGBR|nr:hypothetical protein HNY73_015059 [Argiope bruennichi]
MKYGMLVRVESDDDFDDSDEDPTFNPNVLFNRNSEDISDNNNDSESSENEVNSKRKFDFREFYLLELLEEIEFQTQTSTERELKLQVRGSITEFVAEYDGCELSNVSWKDNKTVTMLSTFAGTNPIAVSRNFVLTWTSKITKRGRPSSAEETVWKTIKKACRKEPPKDIRFDRIDHWPEHSTKNNDVKC